MILIRVSLSTFFNLNILFIPIYISPIRLLPRTHMIALYACASLFVRAEENKQNIVV